MRQQVYVISPVTNQGRWTGLTQLSPGWYIFGYDAVHGPFTEAPTELWEQEKLVYIHDRNHNREAPGV